MESPDLPMISFLHLRRRASDMVGEQCVSVCVCVCELKPSWSIQYSILWTRRCYRSCLLHRKVWSLDLFTRAPPANNNINRCAYKHMEISSNIKDWFNTTSLASPTDRQRYHWLCSGRSTNSMPHRLVWTLHREPPRGCP